MVNTILSDSLQKEESLISLSYLFALSAGDKMFEMEIIKLYLEQTPSLIKRLEVAIEESNFELIQFVTHKLRSSFSVMGIKENGMLQSLEEKAHNQRGMEKIKLTFCQLKDIYERSLISIKNIYNVLRQRYSILE